MSCAECSERVVALISIADGDEQMLMWPIDMQHKLYALRCARGRLGAELAEAVDSARFALERLDRTNENRYARIAAINALGSAEYAYATYRADAAVLDEWLKNADPELHSAAKAPAHDGACPCQRPLRISEHEATLRSWINVIKKSKVTLPLPRITPPQYKRRPKRPKHQKRQKL
jgi:hypothetical protein